MARSENGRSCVLSPYLKNSIKNMIWSLGSLTVESQLPYLQTVWSRPVYLVISLLVPASIKMIQHYLIHKGVRINIIKHSTSIPKPGTWLWLPTTCGSNGHALISLPPTYWLWPQPMLVVSSSMHQNSESACSSVGTFAIYYLADFTFSWRVLLLVSSCSSFHTA